MHNNMTIIQKNYKNCKCYDNIQEKMKFYGVITNLKYETVFLVNRLTLQTHKNLQFYYCCKLLRKGC